MENNFQKELLIAINNLAESNNRLANSNEIIAKFVSSIHMTAKGRIGTNDYATFMNSKMFMQLLKGVYIELQKLNSKQTQFN